MPSKYSQRQSIKEQSLPPLLRLPGEIRNYIYRFVLIKPYIINLTSHYVQDGAIGKRKARPKVLRTDNGKLRCLLFH